MNLLTIYIQCKFTYNILLFKEKICDLLQHLHISPLKEKNVNTCFESFGKICMKVVNEMAYS